jgi:hypothetical protein
MVADHTGATQQKLESAAAHIFPRFRETAAAR